MKTGKVKPFRIISESLTYTHFGTSLVNFRKPAKYVMEYNNPKAEELYKKAQATKNIYEKVALYEQMGHYELKSLSIKERLQDSFKKFLAKCLLR